MEDVFPPSASSVHIPPALDVMVPPQNMSLGEIRARQGFIVKQYGECTVEQIVSVFGAIGDPVEADMLFNYILWRRASSQRDAMHAVTRTRH